MKIDKIYDNGGETLDRYSIIYDDGMFLGLSHNPKSPQGFSMWSDKGEYVDGPHLGKEISFKELPLEVQKYLNHYIFNLEYEKPFLEDHEWKIPLNELDYIEMDKTMSKYQVHFKNPEDGSFKVIREYRGTKGIKFCKNHVEIR